MYCSNCGRENKQDNSFCIGCGASLSGGSTNVVQSVVVNNQQVDNKNDVNDVFLNVVKWFFRIGGIILLICVLGVIGCIFFVANIEESNPVIYEQKNYYVFFDDVSIPTIYNLIKEYDMCHEPSSNTYIGRESIEYFYCDDYMDSDVLEDYSRLLENDYEFIQQDSKEDRIVLVNSTLDDKYNIQVTIFLYRESVEYSKIIKVNLKEEDNSL